MDIIADPLIDQQITLPTALSSENFPRYLLRMIFQSVSHFLECINVNDVLEFDMGVLCSDPGISFFFD